ncbi:MAG TPA: hypothetical protein VK668_23905 [Mucilaginibacter sp.]|nr:hypothetical protein [Mucilaginibacter sp.]
MKYAFILGSNAFIVPQGVISYTGHDHQTKSFLTIRSIYHDTAAGSKLSVDLDIKDILDRKLKLTNNEAENATGFNIIKQRDRILVSKHTGNNTIIDIHQLDDRSAMRLEHNIIAELEVHAPIAVIRIRGDFMLDGTHIEIDNEKLFINGNSIANSSLAGHSILQFAASGVVL